MTNKSLTDAVKQLTGSSVRQVGKFSEGIRLTKAMKQMQEKGVLKPPRYTIPALEKTQYYRVER